MTNRKKRSARTRLALLARLTTADPNALKSAEDQLEQMLDYGRLALQDHLELSRVPYRPSIGPFMDLELSSDDVLAIIVAADAPLKGWEHPASSKEICPPEGEQWCVINGRLLKMSWAPGTTSDQWNGGNALLTRLDYDMDGSHNLMAASQHNEALRIIRPANSAEKVTVEEAFGYMACALAELRPRYLALTHDADKTVSDKIRKVVDAADKFVRLVRDPQLRVLRPLGSEMVGGILQQFALWCDAMEAQLKPRQIKEAGLSMVGALANVFEQMFSPQKAEGHPARAPTPFTRFATTFFDKVGCPYAEKTLATHLQTWRKSSGVVLQLRNPSPDRS